MTKLLVLYYSSRGHIEAMAHAEAAGASEIEGVHVTIKRVAELAPPEVVSAFRYKIDQPAPVLTDPSELKNYDGIIFGTPTRFGNMASQMKNFIDQTGSLWREGALVGKVGGVFTSSASQHGGQETTITSFHTVLLHHGMVVAGLPSTFAGMARVDEITGGSPYGASTLSGPDGRRLPSETELAGARAQGRHIAGIAKKLAA